VQFPKEYEYDAFISYNKADVDFAEKLVKRVERETINGEPIKVFFAEWDIEPGENILLRIEEAEPSSRFIIPILSPDWLNSNWATLERVIPVYDDPAGLKGRIIPIMRRVCEPPPSIRILRWLDFTTDSNFGRESKKLIARIQGKTLRESIGNERQASHTWKIDYQSLTADIQDEDLASDIFTILQIPAYINVALSKIKRRNDVWQVLGEGVDLPTFALDEEEGKIYSFASMGNSQYRFGELCLEPSCKKIPTQNVLSGNDARYVIELLNRAMTKHMREKLGMTYDWRNTKKTFFPLEKNGDETRLATWKVEKGEYTRFLVRKVPLTNPYYVHRSCKATFTQIDDWPFLKVLPGWHFTRDGIIDPVPRLRMSSLSSRWMNMQRNHSVLDEIRYWIYVLSEGKGEIKMPVGDNSEVIIATTPAFAATDRGVEGDYRKRMWHEQPKGDYFDEAMQKTMVINKVFTVDEL
jgi:hypothetical protein